MTHIEDCSNWSLEKLERKIHQAWECAGEARMAGDMDDSILWTEAARYYSRMVGEILRGEV